MKRFLGYVFSPTGIVGLVVIVVACSSAAPATSFTRVATSSP